MLDLDVPWALIFWVSLFQVEQAVHRQGNNGAAVLEVVWAGTMAVGANGGQPCRALQRLELEFDHQSLPNDALSLSSRLVSLSLLHSLPTNKTCNQSFLFFQYLFFL
jgi:hypothetical protein